MPDDSSSGKLNLWKQRLGRVPDWVWERTDLETLVLADNDLPEISGDLGRLTKLRMLDLGHNGLTDLPDVFASFANLTDFLYLHDNRLSSLPLSVAKLTRLRYLNISENRFEKFPEAVSCMSELIELRVSDNRLTSLPESIGRLNWLRELHVRNNQLASLPDAIGALSELRLIDLRGNPLTHLPAAIAQLRKLEKLDLRWVNIPPPVWFRDLEMCGCLVYR